jgi:hypothetical protein
VQSLHFFEGDDVLLRYALGPGAESLTKVLGAVHLFELITVLSCLHGEKLIDTR